MGQSWQSTGRILPGQAERWKVFQNTITIQPNNKKTMNKEKNLKETYESPSLKVTYVTPTRIICTSNEPLGGETDFNY